MMPRNKLTALYTSKNKTKKEITLNTPRYKNKKRTQDVTIGCDDNGERHTVKCKIKERFVIVRTTLHRRNVLDRCEKVRN